MCDTNLIRVNDSHNGNSNRIAINNTNSSTNNFGTQLVKVSDNGDGININNGYAVLSKIALLKQKVAAMAKQIRSGNNVDNNTDNIYFNNSNIVNRLINGLSNDIKYYHQQI